VRGWVFTTTPTVVYIPCRYNYVDIVVTTLALINTLSGINTHVYLQSTEFLIHQLIGIRATGSVPGLAENACASVRACVCACFRECVLYGFGFVCVSVCVFDSVRACVHVSVHTLVS
jgi:hypothetical protein